MTSPIQTFAPRGLIYFWFLNTDCPREELSRHVRAFAEAGVGGLILHPREGLLVPYASNDWFDLIRDLADEVVEAGIQPWLYDEDYCPSGQVGGWIIAEHPEYHARHIVRYEAPAELKEGELFVFPTGMLLWAGLIDPDGNTTEITDRVGTIRRHWEASLTWDSRWYYPATPVYDCPRSGAYVPEFAVRAPARKENQQLVVFLAQTVGNDNCYQGLVDPLNPQATHEFIDRTYVRYKKSLGERFGNAVPAIFTDEPKYHGTTPWTPGMFEDFAERHGYCLRSRLEDLFSASDEPRATLTRLHYRRWLGERFDAAWLKPIADWCHENDIKLVGHISPEDDPVQQAECVSNLFPLQKRFDLAGLDIIVPAVGDADHPLLNVGALTGTSCAQQQDKPGVMSEMLGASGIGLSTTQAARIVAWQVLSGVSSPVIHAAFLSRMGMRLYDAPPDCGPDSPRWHGMIDINREIQPIQDAVTNSVQIAPVAVLWPIRSFEAMHPQPYHAECALRDTFASLLLACFEAQVGIHLLDESDLHNATIENNEIAIGRARYNTVVVPETTVLHEATIDKLAAINAADIPVHLCGRPPLWIECADRLEVMSASPWRDAKLTGVSREALRTWCLKHLPRLSPVTTEDAPDLRTTQWVKGEVTTTLLMNLGGKPCEPHEGITLSPGEIIAMRKAQEQWSVAHRFDTNSVSPNIALPATLALKDWRCRFADEPEREIDQPVAVYQLRPDFSKSRRIVHMTLTGPSAIDGAPIAKWIDYKTTIDVNGAAPRATLVLEPTIIRGRMTISLGDRQWQVNVQDVDPKPTEIDLTDALSGGARELHFRIDQPMPYDGLHVAPTIYSE